jgi:hypothetical protein
MKNEKELIDIIIDLIDNGDGLVDGAETCGHDEEIKDWNRSVKKATKFLGEAYSLRKKELNDIKKQARAEREAKAEKKYLEKQQKEDAKILDQFGTSDLNELIYGKK